MRILILVIVSFFTSCLNKEVPTSTPNCEVIKTPESLASWVYVMDYSAAGMHYKVFSMYNAGVAVINVTKDSLEVANIKSYSVQP